MARYWSAAHYPLNKMAFAGDEFETDDVVMNYVKGLYGEFYRDVCATRTNAKARRYWTKEQNALLKIWIGLCWMNCPYSNLGAWVRHAHLQSLHGATVVGLLPAWLGDKPFRDWVLPYADITFLKHRVKFKGSSTKGFHATFPSMICVWPKSAAVMSPTAERVSVKFDL